MCGKRRRIETPGSKNPGHAAHPNRVLLLEGSALVQGKVVRSNDRRFGFMQHNAVRSHGDRDVVSFKALDRTCAPIRELTRAVAAGGTTPRCGDHCDPSCIQILAQNRTIGVSRSAARRNRGHAAFPIISLGLTQSRRMVLDRAMVRDLDNIEIGTL